MTIDISGQRFGLLVAIRLGENSRNEQRRWECQCDCGNTTLSWQAKLISGNARSCGCTRKKIISDILTTHGYASKDGVRSGEYNSWSNMHSRCSNPNASYFENYGARGIEVCERWLSFENFIADMGPRPAPNYSIERKNVHENYTPDNCIWIPLSDQSKNRRNCIFVQIDGRQVCLAEASRIAGVNYGTVRSRIKRGLTPLSALEMDNG